MWSIEALNERATFLRDISLGWKEAKAEYEGLREVRYTDLKPEMIDTSKLTNVLGNTERYVDDIVRGAADCLVEDTFFIDYNLRTNLLGEALYGQIHTVGLSFRVDWVVKDVVARFYTGMYRKVKLPNDLRKVVDEGKVRNLAGFAAMTGLDERQVGGYEAQTLVRLFQASGCIQCKLTRLVKGCLIYLDHLESGPKTYLRADLKTIHYNVKELLAAMDYEETAYVYTKYYETDSAYNLILYAMCQQYPSPILGGVEHVKIPADGKAIYLVGYYPLMKSYRNVVVSPELVMSAMIEYSKQFGLEEDLEPAMTIACSLRQNRYLEQVGLPTVISSYDLIYAGCGTEEAGGRGSVREETIFLSKERAIMLGRFHQMACLVMFKDFDTSFRNISGGDWKMKSTLSLEDGIRLIGYMEVQMNSSGILQMSKSMYWLRFLQDESMARLRKFSVFEGFWLVKKNPRNVLEDSMIRCLKRGVNNTNLIRIRVPGFKFDDSFEVLMKEVVLGGGDSKLEFAVGGFNVSVSCIRT